MTFEHTLELLAMATRTFPPPKNPQGGPTRHSFTMDEDSCLVLTLVLPTSTKPQFVNIVLDDQDLGNKPYELMRTVEQILVSEGKIEITDDGEVKLLPV